MSARSCLQRIEGLAREKGITRLVLETGEAPGFEAAYRVYERGGFTVCGAVLDYPDSGFSRFYEKKIACMSDLTKLTIAEARKKLRAKEITAAETHRRLSRGDRARQSRRSTPMSR